MKDAKGRLNRSKEKLEQMIKDRSFSFEEFEASWEDFLNLLNTIFSKLEQGAKADSKSKAWYDKIKHERRTDPLLSYVQQARNSEEHTLIGTTDKTGFRIEAVGKGAKVVRSGHKDNRLEVIAPANAKAGEELFRIHAPGIYLVDVTCQRSKKRFPVPTSHLDTELYQNDPISVASLAINYAEEMINIAETMIVEK